MGQEGIGLVGVSELRGLVREAYSAAARAPQASHAFPVGRQFAASLGYPAELLASLPASSVEAFSGVSNVALWAGITEGAAVLDLGCGAGMDALIAARHTGATGQVVGLDFSAAMLARTRCAAGGVLFAQADAEMLPLGDASVDVALVNGIFNLNPAREAIFRELSRVMRPGGSVYAAELVLAQPLSREEQTTADWFAWIAGAKEAGAFLNEFQAAGFREVRLRRTMRNARTKSLHVLAAEVVARR